VAREREHELVLRAVEGAHPRVRLHPDAQVLELGVDPKARREQLAGVSPVHAHEVDRAVVAVRRVVAERLLEKGDELPLTHLPRRHRKLAVLDAAVARDMAIDADVVRRVDEDELRLATTEDLGVRVGFCGIPAQQTNTEHYHGERNHQGISNRLIDSSGDELRRSGSIERRERLGGLLRYYCRAV